jgi:hypothetical protein
MAIDKETVSAVMREMGRKGGKKGGSKRRQKRRCSNDA